jgi:hypothetical protein
MSSKISSNIQWQMLTKTWVNVKDALSIEDKYQKFLNGNADISSTIDFVKMVYKSKNGKFFALKRIINDGELEIDTRAEIKDDVDVNGVEATDQILSNKMSKLSTSTPKFFSNISDIGLGEKIETPDANYVLKSTTFDIILGKFLNIEEIDAPHQQTLVDLIVIVTPREILNMLTILGRIVITHQLGEEIFSAFAPYENYSHLRYPLTRNGVVQETHRTKQSFANIVVKALFYIPADMCYRYIDIKIAKSTIKAAGLGAFAVQPIPEGARGIYKGIAHDTEDTNMYYSWIVKSFNRITGEADDEDTPLYYIDATDLSTSNWTRYVNCGMTLKINNIEVDQVFDKFFYVANRDIEEGEELFVDYGSDYRKYNLGMGKKY